MKTYDGNVEKHIIVSGRVQKEEPDFTADVKPKSEIAEAKVKKENVFSGIALFALNAVAGVVKVLTALYRFIFSRSIIKQTHNAMASTAPATTIEAVGEIESKSEANLATAPAQDSKIDSKVKTSVYAKLVAYRRAAAVYIKSILTPHEAKLEAAPGRDARYRKAVNLKRTSEAIAADSAIMESQFNEVQTGCEAAGSSAPAQIVPAIENTFTAKHKAQAAKASAVGVNIRRALQVTHSAQLATWFLPEKDGDTLRFYQVFSGVQSGNVLEIDLEAESAYWANATNKDGVLGLVFTESVTRTGNTLEVS